MLHRRGRRRGGSISREPLAGSGDCGGQGRVVAEKTYTVDVPAGVDTGATLRLSGRGAAGVRGAGTGDLYVRVRVLPHDRFERSGNDLLAELAVPMTVAALGGEIVRRSMVSGHWAAGTAANEYGFSPASSS